MSFQNLKLDANLLRAIEALHYTQPTEIQARAIPLALENRDLMASAQTGTGKTAAFVLPALQRLLTPSSVDSRGPRVLVLTPTRELAQQITESVQQLGKFMRVNFGTIVGGVGYGGQESLLRRPLDFLVATPGRLMDHMAKGRLDWRRVELLVLDEADRMLDMGFIEDIEHIAKALPAARQTLLFSATLEGDVLRVAQRLLNDPVRVQVAGVKERHTSIEQRVHAADDIKHKHALLSHMLGQGDVSQAIIFTATKRGADTLAGQLSAQGHSAAALHGDMKQGQRNRTVERLRRGKVRVLVATDVAARGLDIKGVTHVINFDLPNSPEDYVHRIGRTGRGGATGVAMSLVGPQEWGNLKRIERLIGSRLERHTISGLEPVRAEQPAFRKPQGGGRGRGGFGNAGRSSGGENRPRRAFGDEQRPRRPFGDEQRPRRASGDNRPPRRPLRDDRPRFSDEAPRHESQRAMNKPLGELQGDAPMKRKPSVRFKKSNDRSSRPRIND